MTAGLFREALSWASPPLVGAVIGYVTNDIAIRMLFRPLREVRLLGLRLPFTPGIFPKERHTLARSVGRMVSRELITEDALRRQVHSEKAQAALARSVAGLTEQVLDAPLSALSAAGTSALSESFAEALRGLLARFLASPAAAAAVRDVVGRAVGSLSRRGLREVLEHPGLRSFVTGRVLPLLAQEDTRRAVGRSLIGALQQLAPSFLSDRLLDSAASALEPMLPLAAARLAEWLRTAPVRQDLEARGAALLSTILDKLNLIQRFLVTAGQFDRRLAEKMPDVVEEAVVSLESMARDPARQQGFLAALVRAVKNWRDGRPPRQPAPADERARPRGAGDDPQAGPLAQAVAGLADRLLSGLSDEGRRERLYARLQAVLLGGTEPTVGEAVSRLLGTSDSDAAAAAARAVTGFLSAPGTSQALSDELLRLAGRFLADNAAVPVREVLRFDQGRKKALDDLLLANLVQVVDAKLPEILRGIDVEQLVVEKIDGLDVRDVERLIREVIATHLKWINVFGAILGFVIGLFQDLLRLLQP